MESKKKEGRNFPADQKTQRMQFTEWVRLEWATVSHLVQPRCSSRAISEHMAQDCAQTVPEYLQ